MGCLITGTPSCTLHHVHGGSVRHLVHKGMGQKVSDWLVIPLRAELHSIGPEAIDGGMGVRAWEQKYGAQLAHLDDVCRQLGVNVWRKAGIEREVEC